MSEFQAGRGRSVGDGRPWRAVKAVVATAAVGAVIAVEGPGAFGEDNGRSACLLTSLVGSALMAEAMPFTSVFCNQGRKKWGFPKFTVQLCRNT